MHERKIVCINPVADFSSKEKDASSWNYYCAPQILSDFLASKGLNSRCLNLNEEFVRAVFNEPIRSEQIKVLVKEISEFEKKDELNHEELDEYLSIKYLCEIFNSFGEDFILPPKALVDTLPRYALMLMKNLDVAQEGIVQAQPDDDALISRTENFCRVMSKVLENQDFNDALLVFSIPAKFQFSSLIASGKIIKKIFPSAKIVVGGSYIKFVSTSVLDNFVNHGIIDFYIKDADEGKLLSLAREFSKGSDLSKGSYQKSENVTINDLRKTTPSNLRTEILLLSNGCYWGKCRFCDFATINPRFACKSPKVMVDEIEHFYNLGKKKFLLVSDCLVPSIGVEIANEIIKRNLQIEWDSAFIRIDPGYSKDVLLLLKKSGFAFYRVAVGMESSEDAALEMTNKGYSRKIINDFIENAKQTGIKFQRFNIIYNLPGPGADAVKRIKDFAVSLLDVTDCIVGGKLYLSPNSIWGKNPEKYGFKFVGEKAVSQHDEIAFEMENDLAKLEDFSLRNFFFYINSLQNVKMLYPNVDIQKLAKMHIYTEKDFALAVKTCKDVVSFHMVFDESGAKKDILLQVPNQMNILCSEQIILFKEIAKLEPDTWYSVGQITDLVTKSSGFERIKLMQTIYRSVIMLLFGRGFAEARLEQKDTIME